jgi:hypothetical protein
VRTLPALLVILAVSCSQATVPVANSTTPAPGASPQASPTPSGLPLTRVAFSCKLPITTGDNHGAFVTFINYEGSYGVSMMDPSTGAVRSVAKLPDVQASGGNRTFWVGSVNPADPSPFGGIGIQPNQIDDQGIYLYTGLAFMRVSTTAGYPANGCF